MRDSRGKARAGAIVKAARSLGMKTLLVTGWGGLVPTADHEQASDVLVRTAVPHSAVLPRVAVGIHHGGAGTTHAFVRAGTPSIIMPFLADQPWWGARLSSLGLGPKPLSRATTRPSVIAKSITEALSQRDKVERAAATMAQEDGAGVALTIIERAEAGVSPASTCLGGLGQVAFPALLGTLDAPNEPRRSIRGLRDTQETPAHFGGGAITLDVVALETTSDKVLPLILATSRPGQNMIDGARRCAAVSTAVAISSKNTSSGNRDLTVMRHLHIPGQHDHRGPLPRSIGTANRMGIIALDNDSPPIHHQDKRSLERHHRERFVSGVEHQSSHTDRGGCPRRRVPSSADS